MTSPYCKFLKSSIVISSSNDTFGYNSGGAATKSITNGTYSTILEVLSELNAQLGAGWTVSCSEVGIVSIEGPSGWSVVFGTTDDGLETLLGFSGSEAVSSDILTASFPHLYGYYPGTISFGYSVPKGIGLTSDSLWVPKWNMSRSIAGNNAQRIIGPTTPSYSRNLSFGLTHKDEIEHSTRGTMAFCNDSISSTFRFYPSRDLGTVASPGTKNTDYYLCTWNEYPEIRQSGQSAFYYTWDCSLNKEP